MPTRLIPRDFSEPEPLNDAQVEALRSVLGGFRELYLLLDSVLPSGEDKARIVERLGALKREADAAVRQPPRLTPRRVADLFRSVELDDRRVAAVVMNATDFAEMRASLGFGDNFDAETSRAHLRRGRVGMLFGAEVFVNRGVPAHRVVIVEDPSSEDPDELTPDTKFPAERLIAI